MLGPFIYIPPSPQPFFKNIRVSVIQAICFCLYFFLYSLLLLLWPEKNQTNSVCVGDASHTIYQHNSVR